MPHGKSIHIPLVERQRPRCIRQSHVYLLEDTVLRLPIICEIQVRYIPTKLCLEVSSTSYPSHNMMRKILLHCHSQYGHHHHCEKCGSLARTKLFRSRPFCLACPSRWPPFESEDTGVEVIMLRQLLALQHANNTFQHNLRRLISAIDEIPKMAERACFYHPCARDCVAAVTEPVLPLPLPLPFLILEPAFPAPAAEAGLLPCILSSRLFTLFPSAIASPSASNPPTIATS